MAFSWNPESALEQREEPRPLVAGGWSHPSWRSLPLTGEPGGSSLCSSAYDPCDLYPECGCVSPGWRCAPPLDALDDAAAQSLPAGACLGSPAAYDDDTSLGRVAASSSASPSLPRGGIVPVPLRDALDLLADLHAVRSRP